MPAQIQSGSVWKVKESRPDCPVVWPGEAGSGADQGGEVISLTAMLLRIAIDSRRSFMMGKVWLGLRRGRRLTPRPGRKYNLVDGDAPAHCHQQPAAAIMDGGLARVVRPGSRRGRAARSTVHLLPEPPAPCTHLSPQAKGEIQ